VFVPSGAPVPAADRENPDLDRAPERSNPGEVGTPQPTDRLPKSYNQSSRFPEGLARLALDLCAGDTDVVELTVIEFAQIPPLLTPAKKAENICRKVHDRPKGPSLLPRGS
jgi:hypothetical protein